MYALTIRTEMITNNFFKSHVTVTTMTTGDIVLSRSHLIPETSGQKIRKHPGKKILLSSRHRPPLAAPRTLIMPADQRETLYKVLDAFVADKQVCHGSHQSPMVD